MISSDLRHYLKAAQGDEPPASSTDARWSETETLARHLIETSAAEAALHALEQEPGRKKRWDLLLLASLLHQGLGERTPSLDALEVVADKLVAANDRDGVQGLLSRFIEPEPVSAAVRLLHYLSRDAATDEERIELLREAIGIRPSDADLHAEIAVILERAGDLEAAREHRLDTLELYLESNRPDLVAEPLFRAVEEDLAHEPGRVAEILLDYAARVPWLDSEPILELALPELEAHAAGEFAWEHLAPLGPRLTSARARATAARLLGVAVAREPNPAAILEGSGIADPALPFDAVAVRLPKILALPPGAYVMHQSWGLGRVLGSDGESLTLEFPGRTGHKMAIAMAQRSLDRLPDDGLRVLAITEPDRLREMGTQGDPEVLVRALRDVGGVATQAQLKPRLDAVLPGYDWTGWWKKARDKWKLDPRLDSSEGYRGNFRLARAGAAGKEIPLPRLTTRAGVEGLNVLRKFLREHPEQESRLKEYAGPYVTRWCADDGLEMASRALALCYALTWHAIDTDQARATLDQLIREGLAPDDLALGLNQEHLLDLSNGATREEEFLWRAAGSRLPRLRARGRERLRVLLGEDRYAKAIEARITRASETPELSARLIDHFLSKRKDPGAPPLESLLLATIRLLERDLPEGLPERLTGLLASGGVFHTAFSSAKPHEDASDAIERTVLHWAGSERRLLPVLEFLHEIGLAGIAEEYERRRRARAQGLLEGKSTEDIETQYTLMSRATYDRLQNEMKKLSLDLKTVIPAAIEKARALGDLRENAEYEAAKLRQANAAQRLQEVMNTIQHARLIETMEIEESRVGVGTEAKLVSLEGNGDASVVYWILGEGDSSLGPGILSYRAPLARPLLGKGVGAEVVLEYEGGPRKFRVESIRKRLPGDPG
ncbi:MAG TPA: GreA/GreB family elongation factor [Candidatus Eisenbacteria bacterium]|nr:GreA/GreB family elongation factor [Candidatus Eisenbacteria bacterium]